MRYQASHRAMHSALRSLCRTRNDEAAFEEWFGAHPLDHLDLTRPSRSLDSHRRARTKNRAAGKRTAFVCSREARARTKSTAELRRERDEALHDLLGDGWDGASPAALAALDAARTAHAAALDALTRYRLSSTAEMLVPLAPGEAEAAVRQLAAAVTAAERAAVESCDPRARRDYEVACERLAQRLAEHVTAPHEPLIPSVPEVWAAADLSPTLEPPEPAGIEPEHRHLDRRANLTVRPTVERLTRALALAPGAPSRAVCV